MRNIGIILLIGLLVAGCTTLGDVKKELSEGGYVLWYPAEAGVEPGQIWQTQGNKRIKQQRKPSALSVDTALAQFKTLKKTVDATASIDLKFSNEILGKAGEMAVLMQEGTVKSVDLNFGKTEIQRITMGDLRKDSIRSQFDSGYLEDLKKVENDNIDYVLITAIVRTAGMKYVFKCEDTSKLELKAPEIAKAVSVDFKLNIVSKTEAVWEVPDSTPLVIGIIPVFGKDLGLSHEDIAKKVEAKIKAKANDETLKTVSPVPVAPPDGDWTKGLKTSRPEAEAPIATTYDLAPPAASVAAERKLMFKDFR